MKRLFVCAMLLSAAWTARSQEAPKPPSAEQMKQGVAAAFSGMAPAMAQMQDAMLESMLKAGERPETATRIATFKKNLFDALLKQGFSEQQALAITLNTQLPYGNK